MLELLRACLGLSNNKKTLSNNVWQENLEVLLVSRSSFQRITYYVVIQEVLGLFRRHSIEDFQPFEGATHLYTKSSNFYQGLFLLYLCGKRRGSLNNDVHFEHLAAKLKILALFASSYISQEGAILERKCIGSKEIPFWKICCLHGRWKYMHYSNYKTRGTE